MSDAAGATFAPGRFGRFGAGRAVLGAVLLAVTALSLGCQPPSTKKATGGKSGGTEKRLRIAVIPKGTTHEFWRSVHFGAEEAAKKYDVEVIWQGPLQESDREGQINMVQNFVTQKVDAICLAPLDKQALIAPCKQAHDKNIPVIIFDSALADDSVIVSYVATNNFHGGELAAEEMARRLKEEGNVVLMRYTTGSESTEQREEGFLKKIAEYPKIKVLSSNQHGGTTPESSLNMAEVLLKKYKGELNGFFAVCEPNAFGAFKAMEGSNLFDKVTLIGFDPNEPMVKGLEAGKMKGIVLQDPVSMGYKAVETAVRHLKGEKVDKIVGTGEAIATPENMNEPRMNELLHPKQF